MARGVQIWCLPMVIGQIATEVGTGLRFKVRGIVKRRNGAVIVWGRCIDSVPTGYTFGDNTFGAYCANVTREGK